MPNLPEVVKPGGDNPNPSAPRWQAGALLNVLGNVAPVGVLVSGIWIVQAAVFAALTDALTSVKDPSLHPHPLQGLNRC